MKTIKIFLASSKELVEDRKEFQELLTIKSNDWKERNISFQLLKWEDSIDAMSKTRSQDEYNEKIRDSDIFVMLYWTKVWDFTTEEFECAYNEFQKKGKPRIYVYFNETPTNQVDGTREIFDKKLLHEIQYFRPTYKNSGELKYKFTTQLDKLYLIKLDKQEQVGEQEIIRTNNEIMQLIAQAGGGNDGYYEAWKELKKFCTPEQAKEADALWHEFNFQPEDFNDEEFKQKFKSFLSECLRDREDPEIKIADNEFYEALCGLNYKEQSENFGQIFKFKNIAPFLLHGENDETENDLNWLSKQLLFEQKITSENYITIDCAALQGCSFDILLNEFYEKFKVNTNDKENDPIGLLIDEIKKRLITGHFVCIIKNAGKLLWNENEMKKLFTEFLNILKITVTRKELHSFVLLFIDANATNSKDSFKDFIFWIDNENADSYIRDADGCKSMKIFDVAPIEKIEKKLLIKWVNSCRAEDKFREKASVLYNNENKLLEKGDRPYQVIEEICSTLNIKIEDKWIK